MDEQRASHREVNHRVLKLIVGLIAISLAAVAGTVTSNEIGSISESYHKGLFPRDFFVGCLFAIAALMFSYDGFSKLESLLSKLGALAAMCIAIFPCGCDGHAEWIPSAHGIAAAVLFSILAVMCGIFYRRARRQPLRNAFYRAVVYAGCTTAIVLSIVVLGLGNLIDPNLTEHFPRIVFVFEEIGLVSFGVAWFVAGHVIPALTDPGERWYRAK